MTASSRAWAGDLSINPYVNVFIELTNKTANANPNDDESHYFELGMVPKYVFAGYPLTIELPTYITLPGSNYYDTSGALFHSGCLWYRCESDGPPDVH